MISRESPRRLGIVLGAGALLMAASLAAAPPTGAPLTSGGAVSAQADTSSDEPECEIETAGGLLYLRCVLADTADAVDLAALPQVPASGDTPIWIQMWGGQGGDGSPTPQLGFVQGSGGGAGFAQFVTTVNSYEATFGTTTMWYALGDAGGNLSPPNFPTGGSGGASTMVTAVDPATPSLQLIFPTNVVGIAGGGGGGAVTFDEPRANGGRGGAMLSNNPRGGHLAGAGGNLYGGGPGSPGGNIADLGKGGTAAWVPSGGIRGNDGDGGVGGTGGGVPNLDGGSPLGPTGFVNDDDLADALSGAGGGGEVACSSSFCGAGGGGGGLGGGASGSSALLTVDGSPVEYPSAGGGGGSYVAFSSVSDPNAPTRPVDGPADGIGAVHVVIQLDLTFETLFCAEAVLSGTEGFRCVVPFNWVFELPDAFVGEEWLVTLQAQGGFGGNGGSGGQAQTTRTTTGLAGETLYAWVGAAGVASTEHGGGGGGASALSLVADPFSAVTSTGATDELLLVAGGGGGGVLLDGQCTTTSGGAGGVAVAGTTGVSVTGDGVAGGGGCAGGGGGGLANGVWTGGAGGAKQVYPDNPNNLESDPGGAGASGLTFVGGLGAAQSGDGASTLTSLVAADTPDDDGNASPGGSGGAGYEQFCQGGGGGAGIAAGGGGAGGVGEFGLVLRQGGGGGGGASFAAASDAASALPAWADEWLTLPDQSQGLVSLFFFQAGQAPPPVPPSGATIDELQPTLGYTGSTEAFSYVISDASGSSGLASRLTTNGLWTIPTEGALTPGTTYAWSVVDGSGDPVPDQDPQTFTVGADVAAGTQGVTMEMRSMNYFATQQSDAPAYLVPEQPEQAVPTADISGRTLDCPDEPQGLNTCIEYTTVLGNPDAFTTYFTTETAVQATTNPGAINIDWTTHDPFGLGLSVLFTVNITGALIVPISGEYTFGVNTIGGAQLSLTAPDGSVVGGEPLIDSWGQIDNCTYTSVPAEQGDDQFWEQEGLANASFLCVNAEPVTVGDPVELEAGVPYALEMNGFMPWRPGPFQLLYSSAIIGGALAPVPGSWFNTDCTSCLQAPDPEPEDRGVDDVDAVARSAGLVTAPPRSVGSTEGCLSGEAAVLGCTVPEPAPQIVAPAACAGVRGTFDALISSERREISRRVPVTAEPDVGASTILTEAIHGDVVIWSFTPDTPTAECTTVRNDRVIVIAPIDLSSEQTEPFGPVDVGLASGSAQITLAPTGPALTYRSPGGVDQPPEATNSSLADGWTLTTSAGTVTTGANGTCDGATPPVDGSDTYAAPDGLLCGWTDTQGGTTNVWYVRVGIDEYQVGWVVEPDGTTTQLFWRSDGGDGWPQLVGVQTDSEAGAQDVAALTESSSIWIINYTAAGDVVSVVSPVAQTAGGDQREAVVFVYEVDDQGLHVATILAGIVSDAGDPGTVTPGEVLDIWRFNASWQSVPLGSHS
ncbi:MAG: PA14 domain-containing protein [Actinomycetota bacterium]